MSLLDTVRNNLFQKPLEKEIVTEIEKSDAPKAFDFGVNFNQFHTQIKRPATSGVNFETLRQFSIFYPVARACINHLITQVNKLEWDIAPIEVNKTKPRTKEPKEKQTIDFFKKIAGPNKSFREFVSEIVEDAEVLDAVAIYRNKRFNGDLIRYTNVDGATIRLMINEDGTTPEAPEIAYQQIIRGTVVADMTTEEMIYAKMHSRTNSPYGLSPLESLITIVSTALKTSSFNLAYLTEGNVPEGFITLPAEIGNDTDKIKEWQNYFDALISGNPTYQTRLKVVPAGVEYQPTKKAEDMSFERFEKWLLQNTCAVFGVPPQSIGFTYEVNRATGETQKDIGEEKGTMVVSRFLKEIFDKIIQEDLGLTNLQFVWTNLDPVNEIEEVDVTTKQVAAGIKSIDEIRIEQGLEPINMPNAYFGGQGPVLLKDFEKKQEEEQARNEQMAQQIAEPKEDKPKTEDIIEEGREINALKKWKSLAKKWVKQGRLKKLSEEVYDTADIHPAVADKIASLLELATTNEDIDRVFNTYIQPEGAMYRAALKLNAELNRVAIEPN